MVCNRCLLVVRQQIEDMHLEVEKITLGEVIISQKLNPSQLHILGSKLMEKGFEILDDKKKILIEKVKNKIIAIIHASSGVHLKTNFSTIIQQYTGTEYSTVSAIFSNLEGITIEQYIILQRIERAKELLIYDELTLGEIALLLGYSSLQHLSSQFKKVTGLTPTSFKKIKESKRQAIDTL